MDTAMLYVKRVGGIESEADYKYTASVCKMFNKQKHANK